MPSPHHLHHASVEELIPLLRLITTKSEFITIFYSILEGGSEYELFAKAILSFSSASDTTMEVLRNVVKSEFEANEGTPTSIMRGNTAASRILGLYCRQRGTPFLRKTLGPPLSSVIGSDISFEIDENKLSGDAEATKKENLGHLLSFVQCILATINTPETILDIPREIKALAHYICQLAQQYSKENTMLLVGGFIMLRFINPALLAPDFNRLVEGPLSLKDRRNLTLLCKLIQNISNQRVCNEEWMLDCNPFIEQNMKALEEFYEHVLMDPLQDSEENEPFADILHSQPDEDHTVNPEQVELDAFRFFHEIFTERKTDLMEIFSQQPHELRTSEGALELVGMLNDYGESAPEEIKLELYYSPLCPFSRAVWLFCLQSDIPIVMHKIDLLKEDQALDKEYKQFSLLSPSMQVPLLIDGEFVIEESAAICAYLCDRFYIANSWLPKARPFDVSKVYQALDWMHGAIQVPILRLWEACKNPTEEDIQMERYSDLMGNLHILDTMYYQEKLRLGLPITSPYYQGGQPSLVDLFAVLVLHFAQLVQGFTVSRFPHLKLAYFQFVSQFSKKHWKAINYEFEGFFKYIITATSTSSAHQIQHSVLFQEAPATIYEMVQDPENDIFLFLASKTISTKTNAKLKRGLQKLETGADGSAVVEETTEEPYVVNLEIGGEFNIRGREGTNLLLVPGKKIVQTSRMHMWEKGITSTCIFEFELTPNSQALLHFTELNCPSEHAKGQEDAWIKFWKKINGVRVEAIEETIYFKGKACETLYEQMTDWKVLAKVLKSKIKIEPSGAAMMHNNKVYANITGRTPNRQIIQKWRSMDWPEDLYSVCTMDMEAYEGGSRIHFRLNTVPLERVKAVEKMWKSNMWKKLGGVACDSLHQKIAFQSVPAEVYGMWVMEASLTQSLKSKCTTGSAMGSSFVAQHLKGEVAEVDQNKRIVLRVSHKDWPQHLSIVTLVFHEVEKGTEMEMHHENIPAANMKTVADMWNNEFWEKMKGIQTTDVSASTLLNTTAPEVLYQSLLDGNVLAAITGTGCSVIPQVGGSISMYEKLVKGTITALEKSTSIDISLRYFDWPFNHYSQMHYQLDEINGGKGTLVTLRQRRVPVNHTEEVSRRCEEFCKQLKTHKFPKN